MKSVRKIEYSDGTIREVTFNNAPAIQKAGYLRSGQQDRESARTTPSPDGVWKTKVNEKGKFERC